ncbi:hypothetical protein DPMN_031876 [Dreissena polymorpha]|uniref:Uncharacterized protein n=1 Tax=Dreissena polymorpha TaxID=45954 RepID=A0A9D4RHQ4_DREPO|nr:hypothetical protein DPMN_031876 [Dreissena polymorpha]
MPTSSLRPELVTLRNKFRNAYQLSMNRTCHTQKHTSQCLPALYDQNLSHLETNFAMPTSSLRPELVTLRNKFRNAYQLSTTRTYHTQKQISQCLPALYDQYLSHPKTNFGMPISSQLVSNQAEPHISSKFTQDKRKSNT